MAEAYDINVKTLESKLPKPKRGTVDLSKVKVHPLNFRFNGSNNELKLDTRGIGELRSQVERDGRINKPLVILKDNDGLWALVGGRRTEVGHAILNDPTSSQELVAAMKNVDADIYENLNAEQILFLVNDQDQKAFCFSEVLELELHLFSQGKNWKQVANVTYRQRARLTGQAKILNEVDAMTDKVARDARIAKWLHGSVGEMVGEAFNIGPIAVRQLRLMAAEKDKLIRTKANTKPTEQIELVPGPEVKLTEKRLDKLRLAKKKDLETSEWNGLTGGPTFNKVWETLKRADRGECDDEGHALTPEGKPKKSLSREKLVATLQNGVKSRLAGKMLNYASGDDGVTWQPDDEQTAAFEAMQSLYLLNVEKLAGNHPKFKKVLGLIFNGQGNIELFKEALATLINQPSYFNVPVMEVPQDAKGEITK